MKGMQGHLLVSVSSIFDDTRKSAAGLISELDKEGVPVSLLVAPHIDGNWHLAKDPTTKQWLQEQQESGRLLILNGFDQAVQGRRAEFANLDAHEANLRLKGATRQMSTLGFEFKIFAPPRWRMSPARSRCCRILISRWLSRPLVFMTCALRTSTSPATCLMARASARPSGGDVPSSALLSAGRNGAILFVFLFLGATSAKRKSTMTSCAQ